MLTDENLETLDLLAASFAHEVKNPLMLIQSNVEYLQLFDKENEFSKNFFIIKRELKKTNDMLKNFVELVMSAYSTNEEVAIYDVISDVIENYSGSYGNKIKFDLNCFSKNIYVKGNYNLLNIVFSNIIKNAIEAISSEGKIDIVIDCDNKNVLISVKDNGIGISEEIRKLIFSEKYFTNKEGGSGIGTQVCKKIIAQHGGDYFLKNSDEGGSVVEVTLPLENIL